ALGQGPRLPPFRAGAVRCEAGRQAGGVLHFRGAVRFREPVAGGVGLQDERRGQDREPRGALRPAARGVRERLLAAALRLYPLRSGLPAAPGERGHNGRDDGGGVLFDRLDGSLRHRPARVSARQHRPYAGPRDGLSAPARGRGAAAGPVGGPRGLEQPPGDALSGPPRRPAARHLVSRGVFQGASGGARGGGQGGRERAGDLLARRAAGGDPRRAYHGRAHVRVRLEPVPLRPEPGLRGEAAARGGGPPGAAQRPPARDLRPRHPAAGGARAGLPAPRGDGLPLRRGRGSWPPPGGPGEGARQAGRARCRHGRAAARPELGAVAVPAPRVGRARLPVPPQLRGGAAARPGREARGIRERLPGPPRGGTLHHLQLSAVLPAGSGPVRVALRAGVLVRAPDLAAERRRHRPLRRPDPLHAHEGPHRRPGRRPDLPGDPLRPALVLPRPGGPPRPRPLVGRALRGGAVAGEAQDHGRRGPPVRRGRLDAPDLRARGPAHGVRVAPGAGTPPPGAGARRGLLRRGPRLVPRPERRHRRRVLSPHRHRQHKRVPVGAGQLQRLGRPSRLPAAPARGPRVLVEGAAGPGVVARGALPGPQRSLRPARRQGRLRRQLPARALGRALPGDRRPRGLAARTPAPEGVADLLARRPGARARPVLARPLGPAGLRRRWGAGGRPAIQDRRRGRRAGPDGRVHGPPSPQRQAHPPPALRDDPALPRRLLEPGPRCKVHPPGEVLRHHDVGATLRQGHKARPLDRRDDRRGRGQLRTRRASRGHGSVPAGM
ncbi:MAG: hypothetical protein AVDCRST_MAG02-3348, partial [uncultured Rubrobacteraceae bacterium]